MMVVRCRCYFWSLIFVVAALFRVQAAPTTLAEIPFQYREGLLWIEVNIPQSDKHLNFLVDSGAEVSVVNLEVAQRLDLPLGQSVNVRSVEASMTGYWPQKLAASANGVALPSDFLALDLSKLNHACEQPVDGLIGADFFKGKIVEIDFRAKKIRLLNGIATSAAADTLPLEIRRCGMCVKAGINGGKLRRFRVDTGCATALQWVTSSVPPERCTSKVAVGLAEFSIPQTLTTVSLAGRTFNDVPTGVHRAAIFDGEVGLLGNPLLARFGVVTFDAKSGRIILGHSSTDWKWKE